MNKFGKISIITAGLMLPTTVLLSSFVQWQLKGGNPDNVDITSSLAYLKQILATVLGVFTVFFLISLVSAIVGLKKDASKELSKLGIFMLVLITIVSIVGAMTLRAANEAEDRAKQQAAQEFFQKLKETN